MTSPCWALLLTLLGPGTYLTLVRDRGWAPERAIGWLAETVPSLILEPPQS